MRKLKLNAALVAGAILLAGYVISLAVNWPGHLSFDSVVQLYEGRTARYGNWHPPVMSWILGAFDWALPGTGLFIVLDTTLLFGSVLSLMALSRRVSWVAPAVAMLLVVTPQFFLYSAIVWKDVLFANAGVAGFVALAHAARCWSRPHARFTLIVLAILLLVLAALARQNGAILLPFGVGALIGVAILRREPARSACFAYGIGAAAALVLITCAAYVALQAHVTTGVARVPQVRLLQVYDLAGALARDRSLALDRMDDDDPALGHLMRTDAARLYTPVRNDTLTYSPALQAELRNVDDATIPAQWQDFVRERPLLYVDVRAAAFEWVFLTPNLMRCVPFAEGVVGPPDLVKADGLRPRMDTRDYTVLNYASRFMGTPVLSHLFYAVLAGFALALLLIRRRAVDIPIAAMLVAAYGFTATFFFISIACDYRYLYFLDVAAMAAAMHLAVNLGGLLRVLRLRELQARFR